jgi:CheY-like chemotaxis protein
MTRILVIDDEQILLAVMLETLEQAGYDAVGTDDRPYQRALMCDEIVRELEHGRGTQWDPKITDAALRLIDSGELQVGAGGLEILVAA